MKDHFKPDDSVWDIFIVCTVIRNARFLIHFVAFLLALHPELPSTEAAKDSLRSELCSVTEMVLTVRNLLEHGGKLGLAAFRSSTSHMARGLALIEGGGVSAPGARLLSADKVLDQLLQLQTGESLIVDMSGAQCAYALASRALEEVEVKLREFVVEKNPQASPKELEDLASLCEALKGSVPTAGVLVKSRNNLAHGGLQMAPALKVLEEVDKTMKKIGQSSAFLSAVPSLDLVDTLQVLVERTPSDDSHVKELPQPRVRTALVGRDEQVLELTCRLAVEGARVGLHGSMGVGKTLLAKSLLLFFEEGASCVLGAGFIAGLDARHTFGPEVSRFRYFKLLSGSSLTAYQRDWVSFARTLADLHYVPLPGGHEKMSDADLFAASSPRVARFLGDAAMNGHEFLLLVDDLSSEAVSCVSASLPLGSRCSIVVTAISEHVVSSVHTEPTNVVTLPLEACLAIIHAVHDDYKRVPGIDELIANHLECHTLTVCVLAGLLRARPRGTTCHDHFVATANAYLNSDPSTVAEMTGPIDAHARGLGGFVSLALERLMETASEEVVKELLGRLVIVGAGGVWVPSPLVKVKNAEGLVTSATYLGLVEVDALDDSLVTMHRLVSVALERKWAGTGLFDGRELWEKLAVVMKDGLNFVLWISTRSVDENVQMFLPIVDNILGCKYYNGVITEDVVRRLVGKVFLLAGELAMKGSRLGAAIQYIEEAKRLFGVVGGAEGGSSTLETAAVMATVGSLNDQLGKYEEALEYHRQSLVTKVAVYGSENHADVVYSLNNIGGTLESLGRYEEALEHFQCSQAIMAEVLGSENHEAVANVLNNLGITLRSLGRYEEALEHQQRSLAIRSAGYGSEKYTDVGNLLSNIGLTLKSLGRYEEALEHQRLSMTTLVAGYGSENHVAVATSLNNMGNTLQSLERYEDALEHYRRALAITVAVYGSENHAHVASSLNNIGTALGSCGMHKEALEHHRRSLAINMAMYGSENHADVAKVLGSIGEELQSLERYEEALEHQRRALAMFVAVYGSENHADVARSLATIGLALASLERYEEALEHQRRALAMFVVVYGSENHAGVAASLNNIGITLESLGLYEEALVYYRRSLAISLEVHGSDDHEDVADSLMNIGGTLLTLKRCDEALEHYQRLLAISVAVYGSENHASVATLFSNIGVTLQSLGRYDEALGYFRRSWATRLAVYKSENHPDVATSLVAMGFTLFQCGRLEEALEKFQWALKIFNKVSGPGSSPDLARMTATLQRAVQDKKSRRKMR